jgi:2',3'-cyclic-nucleotide 2'-phosphodiesterase (5'-nucleotidase family)
MPFLQMIQKYFFFFFLLFLLSCGSAHYNAIQYDYHKQTMLRDTSASNTLNKKFLTYKIGLDSIMEKEIGMVEKTLTKKPIESTLGNWMCDAMIWYAENKLVQKPDFAITNYGGIRIQSLDKGPLKLKKIFELMPFDNALVLATINGAVVTQMLESTTRGAGQPCSKELRYEISKDSGLHHVMIKNVLLDSTKMYKVLLTDYMMNGGDKMEMLKGQPNESYPDLLRNALLEYCKYLKHNNLTVNAEIDGRAKFLSK